MRLMSTFAAFATPAETPRASPPASKSISVFFIVFSFVGAYRFYSYRYDSLRRMPIRPIRPGARSRIAGGTGTGLVVEVVPSDRV